MNTLKSTKLSQLPPSPNNADATTQFPGVVPGATTDYLFSQPQLFASGHFLSATVKDQLLSGGWNVVAQPLPSGDVVIDCGLGPLQTITNIGNFSVTAPQSDG